jgi:hypothetical protein
MDKNNKVIRIWINNKITNNRLFYEVFFNLILFIKNE